MQAAGTYLIVFGQIITKGEKIRFLRFLVLLSALIYCPWKGKSILFQQKLFSVRKEGFLIECFVSQLDSQHGGGNSYQKKCILYIGSNLNL